MLPERHLSALIADLTKYMQDELHVISKSSLIALLEYIKLTFRDTKNPFNCDIINIKDFDSKLSILLNNNFKNTKSHIKTQFIIETGDGNKQEDGVHYSALDIQINNDGTFYCGSMDSTLRNNPEVEKSIQDIPGFKRFYQCSGGLIQKDAWSCPFYGLTFAIALHEADINYSAFNIKTPSKTVNVPWGNFTPQFIWNAQSWSFLTMYIDAHSDYSGKDSSILIKQFSLGRDSFFSHVTRSLVIDKEGKVINKGIRLEGEKIVKDCLHFIQELTEKKEVNMTLTR